MSHSSCSIVTGVTAAKESLQFPVSQHSLLDSLATVRPHSLASPHSSLDSLATTSLHPALTDRHMHLSLGFHSSLAECDYRTRMWTQLGQAALNFDFDFLHKLQLPLCKQVYELLCTAPWLKLHVQSVSSLDSVFNYSLLTHPMLKSLLNQRLFLYMGVHPWYMPQHQADIEQELGLLYKMISIAKAQDAVYGLGEIGLDKCHGPDLSVQLKFLQHLLELNQQYWHLSVSLHCVKAYNELLSLIKGLYPATYSKSTHQGQKRGQQQGEDLTANSVNSSTPSLDSWGVLHGFSSSVQMAQSFWAYNFKLGLGLRWQRAEMLKKLHLLLQACPDIKHGIVLETDHDGDEYPLALFEQWHNTFCSLCCNYV